MRTYASIAISTTALVVAVFGSTPIGEAAWSQIVPTNSIGSPQLKRNSVKSRQLAPNAVRSVHVLNGSLLAADFRAGQLPKGEKGDPGPVGPPGPQGPAGPNSVTVHFVDTMTPTNGYGSATALCPAGETAISGGVHLRSGSLSHTYYSDPGGRPDVDNGTPTGWRSSWFQDSGSTETIRVYAVCTSRT